VSRDEIATDGRLALAGVEATSDLVGGGDAGVDGNGHRAGTVPQRIRLDRRHEKTSVDSYRGSPAIGLYPEGNLTAEEYRRFRENLTPEILTIT
jgi:hypothetical protein